MSAFEGIVLAGGASSRLGGVDKRQLDVGGETLLDRAISALCDARRVIVAGPPIPVRRSVLWVREDPPGGGPVAATAAALEAVTVPIVVLLAADMPFVNRRTVESLISALGSHDAAVVRSDGFRHPLCAAYRTDAVRAALSRLSAHAGASMRQLTSALDLVEVDDEGAAFDCDTWSQVETARRLAAAAVRS